LGIAALEDKIAQHAVGTVLNQIWEKDFEGFSYGFREGRSQQDAGDALYVGITQKKVNWVLDLDVKSFFDRVEHDWTIRFVEHRMADRRIVRPIRKWLQAGVMEDGRWFETKGRDSAGVGDFADPGRSLPALCTRYLGKSMAGEGGAG
jgi:retron-type reverse transcriptase